MKVNSSKESLSSLKMKGIEKLPTIRFYKNQAEFDNGRGVDYDGDYTDSSLYIFMCMMLDRKNTERAESDDSKSDSDVFQSFQSAYTPANPPFVPGVNSPHFKQFFEKTTGKRFINSDPDIEEKIQELIDEAVLSRNDFVISNKISAKDELMKESKKRDMS